MRTPIDRPSACTEFDCRPPAPVPIVAWSTPYLRAARLFHEVGEDLEFKRREVALAKLKQHLAQVRELMQFIEKYPSLNYENRDGG